ncbi:MAG TPA: MgtC/SapB family protein [Chloroflexota bacterium]|nr:MgtC/SapB family protein [Chloroflexota bacterium]
MDHLPPLLQLELLGRLVASVVLGGVLGIERQLGQHPAGLRTHILVSLGAGAYTVASTYGVEQYGTVQDAGRIAAQIVAGVGFLGAGTIWRSGSDRIIYGLTTAASIWVAASIGMLAGFGLYILAAGSAILGFVVLRLLKGLEEAPLRVPVPRLRRRTVRTAAEPELPLDGALTSTTFAPEAPEAGILSAPETPSQRRKRGKKTRKRKRRDVELESMSQISDAPGTP